MSNVFRPFGGYIPFPFPVEAPPGGYGDMRLNLCIDAIWQPYILGAVKALARLETYKPDVDSMDYYAIQNAQILMQQIAAAEPSTICLEPVRVWDGLSIDVSVTDGNLNASAHLDSFMSPDAAHSPLFVYTLQPSASTFNLNATFKVMRSGLNVGVNSCSVYLVGPTSEANQPLLENITLNLITCTGNIAETLDTTHRTARIDGFTCKEVEIITNVLVPGETCLPEYTLVIALTPHVVCSPA